MLRSLDVQTVPPTNLHPKLQSSAFGRNSKFSFCLTAVLYRSMLTALRFITPWRNTLFRGHTRDAINIYVLMMFTNVSTAPIKCLFILRRNFQIPSMKENGKQNGKKRRKNEEQNHRICLAIISRGEANFSTLSICAGQFRCFISETHSCVR